MGQPHPDEREHWRQTGRLRLRSEWLDTELGYGLVEEMHQFPHEDLAAGIACPLLIFHGMRDNTIPYGNSVAFVERAAHPDIELRLLKDGDREARSSCRFLRCCATHGRGSGELTVSRTAVS